MDDNQQETVLITGVTSFIGSWIAYTILNEEEYKAKYKVAGTVRSKSNTEKLGMYLFFPN